MIRCARQAYLTTIGRSFPLEASSFLIINTIAMNSIFIQHFQSQQRHCITEEFMEGNFCLGMHRREWFFGFVTSINGTHYIHIMNVSLERPYIHSRMSFSPSATTKVLPLRQGRFSSLAIGDTFYLSDRFLGVPLMKTQEERVEHKRCTDEEMGHSTLIPIPYLGCAQRFLTPQEPSLELSPDDYVYTPMTM